MALEKIKGDKMIKTPVKIKEPRETDVFIRDAKGTLIAIICNRDFAEQIVSVLNAQQPNCKWIPKSEQSKNKRERLAFPPRDNKGRFTNE